MSTSMVTALKGNAYSSKASEGIVNINSLRALYGDSGMKRPEKVLSKVYEKA